VEGIDAHTQEYFNTGKRVTPPAEPSTSKFHEIRDWCNANMQGYQVRDIGDDWKNGCAILALFNGIKPGVVDILAVNPLQAEANITRGLDLFEEHFGLIKFVETPTIMKCAGSELKQCMYVWLVELRRVCVPPEPATTPTGPVQEDLLRDMEAQLNMRYDDDELSPAGLDNFAPELSPRGSPHHNWEPPTLSPRPGGMLDGGGPSGGPQIIRGDEISTKQKIDMLRRQRDEGIISRDDYKRAKQQQQLNQLRKQKKSGVLTKADYKLRKAELLDKSHKEKPTEKPKEPVDYNTALAFERIDKNGDGMLSRDEVIKACKSDSRVRQLLDLPAEITEGPSRQKFDKAFRRLDKDDSKTIDLTEFASLAGSIKEAVDVGKPIALPPPPEPPKKKPAGKMFRQVLPANQTIGALSNTAKASKQQKTEAEEERESSDGEDLSGSEYSDSSEYSSMSDNSDYGAGAGQFWHNPVAVGFLATMIRTAAKRRRMRQKSKGAGKDYVSAKNYAHMNEKKVE